MDRCRKHALDLRLDTVTPDDGGGGVGEQLAAARRRVSNTAALYIEPRRRSVQTFATTPNATSTPSPFVLLRRIKSDHYQVCQILRQNVPVPKKTRKKKSLYLSNAGHRSRTLSDTSVTALGVFSWYKEKT